MPAAEASIYLTAFDQKFDEGVTLDDGLLKVQNLTRPAVLEIRPSKGR